MVQATSNSPIHPAATSRGESSLLANRFSADVSSQGVRSRAYRTYTSEASPVSNSRAHARGIPETLSQKFSEAAVSLLPLALCLLFALPPVAYGSPTAFWFRRMERCFAGDQDAPFERWNGRAMRCAPSMEGRVNIDITVISEAVPTGFAQPLALDSRDSGQNGRDVVYRAAPGEHPVYLGSMPVRNWSLHDPTSISTGPTWVSTSRASYTVNGQRAIRARTEPYPAAFLPVFTRSLAFFPRRH